MSRMLKWLLSCGLMLTLSLAQADEPKRLPGELPLDFGRELIGATRLPTLSEIEQAVREPDMRPLLLFRLHGDQRNHYAPAWSQDGRALACLRADIDDRTCKVLVFPELHRREPLTIYEDSVTFEHMLGWTTTGHRQLAFSSNRGDDQQENIHLWELNGQPRVLTSGGGTKVLPQLSPAGNQGRVLFRRIDQFELLTFAWDRKGSTASQELGPADEMRLSPTGDVLAVVRSAASQERGKELSVRTLSTQREVRLIPASGRLLRNPTWSPDGRWLAFWSRPLDAREWELWTVGQNGEPAAARQVVGARVQEDFRHVGPAWSPDSKRLWFTLSRGEQSYYPLSWVTPDGARRGQVEYEKSLTTAFDLATCPQTDSAALSFVAVAQRPLDVYVMLLNHQ